MSRTPLRQNIECSYQDLAVLSAAMYEMIANSTDLTPRELKVIDDVLNKLIEATTRMRAEDNHIPPWEDPDQIAFPFPKHS